MLIRVTRSPTPKLYMAGHRAHHGMTGLLLSLLGVALMWHDRHDFPWTSDLTPFRFTGP